LATDKVSTVLFLLSKLQQHNQETSTAIIVDRLYYLAHSFNGTEPDRSLILKAPKTPKRNQTDVLEGGFSAV
jgi:hypothetical protein